MWDALKDHLVGRTGRDAEEARREAWRNAPDQFYYPSAPSTYYAHPLGRHRTRSRAPYKTRRMRAADRAALNRINKKPEPYHRDQLRLF